MKKIVLALLVMGLFIAGFWWTILRRPDAVPPMDDNPMIFRMEPAGRGSLISYDNPRTPLRFLRWLPPLQGGFSIVQVVTQTDRQQVSLFKDAVFQASYLVPKPAGVRDGFFRLAELRDALVVEGDVAVLLYATSGSGTDELPLLVALDLKTQDIRWIHRAAGERLVGSGGQDPAVYLFGPKAPPVRLPLALSGSERLSPAGARSTAKPIELPSEIQETSDLRPTGSWTFLLAHKGGLSAYLGSKGWRHLAPPEGNPGLFKEVQGVLTGDGKNIWWQPFPGTVLQVLPDGTPKAPRTAEALVIPEPFAKDAALLHLLGADPEGKLWFDLAVPSQTPAVESRATQDSPTEPQWKPEAAPAAEATTLPAVVLMDWPAYASQGLDRIYSWDPRKKALQDFTWSTLAVPGGFPKPVNGLKLVPGSGSLLLENGSSAWLLPLAALAQGAPGGSGQPAQPK